MGILKTEQRDWFKRKQKKGLGRVGFMAVVKKKSNPAMQAIKRRNVVKSTLHGFSFLGDDRIKKERRRLFMGFRLLIGRAGTGKTQYCLEEIGQKQKQQKGRFLLLVPEQYSSQAHRELMEQTQSKSILQAEVLDFRKLAYRVFQKRGLEKTTLLGDVGKSMTLRKILNQKKEELVYFKNSLNQQGFVDQLSATISELFQYRFTIEDIKEYEKKQNLSQKIKDKLFDLQLIMEEYEAFLKKEYISADEVLDLLANKLQAVQQWKDTEIWIDGFYSFTPQEYDVIGQMMRLAKDVTVTLTMDDYTFHQQSVPMFNGFFEPFMTAKRLKEIASEQNCPMKEPVLFQKNQRTNKEALLFLEKNYFRYYRKSTEATEGITLICAKDQYDEMTKIAEEMIFLAREKNIRYKEMAIVTNGLSQYEKSLKGILEEFEIPYFIDAKREIISHPLIEVIRSVLDVAAYHFHYEGMFRYLKTGFSLLTQSETDELENYVLAHGIKGQKWLKDTWEYGMQYKTPEQKEHINTLREKAILPLKELYEKSKKKQTLLEWIKCVFAFLQTIEAAEKTMELAENAESVERAREHQQIWSMLTELLEKGVELLGNEKMSIVEFSKIIEAGLEQSKMGVIPPTVDSVIVGDIERSRLPEVKVLFVLGANEGILPSPIEYGGVFSEGERNALLEQGAELAFGGKRKAFEEQYFIYRGLTKPSEALYISYCAGDLEGKPMRPSSVIARLKKLFPNLQERVYENELCHMATAKTAIHFLGEEMRKHFLPQEDMQDLWKDAYSYYNTDLTWQKHIALLKKGLFAKEVAEGLSKKMVSRLYGKTVQCSVSKLEKFSACPFAFFAEYGLKAKQRKLYQLQIPDLGILFHEVMEYFSTELSNQNIDWKKLNQQQSDEIIEKAVEETAPKLSNQILFDTAGNRYLLQRLKRISKRAAWTLAQHMQMGDFKAYGAEIGFGLQQALPPIVIELEEGEKLILNGKIDRVDILDKAGKRYVKIIDYKSGSKEFDYTDIFYGLQLQLLIYLDAFLENSNEQEAIVKPGAVFYFRMQDPSIHIKKEMSAEEIYGALFRELRMSGLVLDNVEVIQGLDHIFESEQEGVLSENTSSAIIPVSVKSNGILKETAQVASEENYKRLMAFAKQKAKQAGEALLSGEIGPYPYRKKEQSYCDYCVYHSICRFDTASLESQYRLIQPIKRKAFWEMLSKEEKE